MKKMNWEESFIKALKEAYAQHREVNPRFSLRAFAKKIGLASGTLTVILNQKKKWKISAERAAEIVDMLNLSQSAKNSLLIQMGLKPVIVTRQMEQADYPILLDWTYQPILMFFTLPVDKRDPKHIANALGLEEAKVNSVIDDAVARGLLVKKSDGQIERPEELLTSTDGPPSEVVRKHHKLNLEMAARSLNEQIPDLRDFTSFTFSGDGRKLKLLAKEIRDLYHKASLIMDGGPDNDKVFRLSVQLFPMEFQK
jgi:uncharacterized protein (TIGR02147 family)